jgi:hypothetical protein
MIPNSWGGMRLSPLRALTTSGSTLAASGDDDDDDDDEMNVVQLVV